MEDRNRPELEPDARPWPRSGLQVGGLIAALVAIVLLGGVLLSSSFANAAGHWFGRHRHGGEEGRFDPERAHEHARLAVEWLSGYVDVDDAQREQLDSILSRSVDDLVELSQGHQSNRGAFVDLLRQPVIDRAALEEIRRSELDLAEEASRRLVDALADAAQVLTPEQRGQLVELAERFHH